MIKTGLAGLALAALMSTATQAQIAGGTLKIGVLDDGEWDLYKLLATVPAAEAYFTFEDSGCKPTN